MLLKRTRLESLDRTGMYTSTGMFFLQKTTQL